MLFIIAVVPGVLAIISTLFIKEFKKQVTKKKEIVQASLFAFTSYWKGSPANYKKLVAGLLLFALINSSDIFLLLKMKESGQSDTVIIGIYIFYNLVYAICAYPLGILADKIGLKSILITGLCIFSIVYTGFALNENMYVFFLLFALYGIYAAATEGISKAWISNLVPKNETASALGTFSGFQSICAMIASTIAGLIWYNFGASATFVITASLSTILIVYFSRLK